MVSSASSCRPEFLVCFVEGMRVIGKTAPTRIISQASPLTLFSIASSGRQPMNTSAVAAPISGPNGLRKKDAMSAIQIVCAVAVPLLWGYQFVAIKVGVLWSFRRSSSSRCAFLAIALLLFIRSPCKKPTRQQFGPDRGYVRFSLAGLNFGLFYVGLGLGSPGSISTVAYQQLALPFTILLAWPLSVAERPVSNGVRRSGDCIRRRGRAGRQGLAGRQTRFRCCL